MKNQKKIQKCPAPPSNHHRKVTHAEVADYLRRQALKSFAGQPIIHVSKEDK